MRLDLSGKTALVTGSTQGIGEAIAAGLAAAGARVGVNGRRRDRIDAAIARIRETVPDADLVAVEADVTEESGAHVVAAIRPVWYPGPHGIA